MQEGSRRLTRAEQKTRTRERLVAAARRVIARRGLTGASVDAISEDAGFSSGAFYSNFESKDEVFAAALDYHSREFDRFLQEHPGTGSVRARLAADGEWLESLEDWRVLFWLEIVAQGGRSDALKPALREYFGSARARLTRQIEEGARESGTSPARPAEELARVVLAAEIGLFVQAMFDDEPAARSSFAALLDLVAGDEPSRAPPGAPRGPRRAERPASERPAAAPSRTEGAWPWAWRDTPARRQAKRPARVEDLESGRGKDPAVRGKVHDPPQRPSGRLEARHRLPRVQQRQQRRDRVDRQQLPLVPQDPEHGGRRADWIAQVEQQAPHEGEVEPAHAVGVQVVHAHVAALDRRAERAVRDPEGRAVIRMVALEAVTLRRVGQRPASRSGPPDRRRWPPPPPLRGAPSRTPRSRRPCRCRYIACPSREAGSGTSSRSARVSK